MLTDVKMHFCRVLKIYVIIQIYVIGGAAVVLLSIKDYGHVYKCVMFNSNFVQAFLLLWSGISNLVVSWYELRIKQDASMRALTVLYMFYSFLSFMYFLFEAIRVVICLMP